MRIVIAGSRSFGAAALRMLARDHTVMKVLAPAWGFDRLAVEADERGIPLERTQGQGIGGEQVPECDLLVAAHSHDWISRQAREQARLGAIGYHPSLLPRHRGRSSIEWTIRFADPIAGGSVYWLDDRIDAGPLAAQDWCWVRPGDDASKLWRRELFDMGLRLLAGVADDLADGRIVRVPQDEALASWEPATDPPPLRRPDLPQIPARTGGEHPEHVTADPADLRPRVAT